MTTAIDKAMYAYQLARAELIREHLKQDPNQDLHKLAHYLTVKPIAMLSIIRGAIDGTYPVEPN